MLPPIISTSTGCLKLGRVTTDDVKTAFQLFFGKLYMVFSIKCVFLIGLAVFELGSLLCAVAPTSVALIIGRAIAGVGSGSLFAGAMIIIAHTVPLSQRPVYMGGLAGVSAMASVAGPLVSTTLSADQFICGLKSALSIRPLTIPE